jgi:hypothetical protein
MSRLTRNMAVALAALMAFVLPTAAIESGPAAAALPRPTASTGLASSVTSSSVTLTGSTYPSNQQTEYYFEYGQTLAYGAQTPLTLAGSGKQTIHVRATVTGLSPYTAYHYRLVAINAAGATDGADRTFKTMKVPLTFVLSPVRSEPFGDPFSVNGTIMGTGSADHSLVLQAKPFPFLGGFRDVGTPTVSDQQGNFSFVVGSLTRNTQLRVSTLEQPAAKSNVVTALVAVRVTIHVHGVGRAGFVRFSGTVMPAQPGAQVLFQRLTAGGKPSLIGSQLIRSGDRSVSRFSRTLRVRRSAFYRAYVQVVSGAQVSSQSRAVLVR